MASNLRLDSSLDALLVSIQRDAFHYFVREANPRNGLVRDKTRRGAPASIAATGLALTAYPVGVERKLMTRAEATGRTLTVLRFFDRAPHGPQPDATGYRGFYYHFLDLKTGRRADRSELSSVDTAILLAGVLTAASYFSRATPAEREIRALAGKLYRRADWHWMQHGDDAVCHGWTPERGFLRYQWKGYNEAMIVYILGLASPTHPLTKASYRAWCSAYRWKEIYGIRYLYAGPLFTHQLSHVWIDFRGIRDAEMKRHGLDYFENSRRAALVHQQYAIRNPRNFAAYGEFAWGLTASDGPGPEVRRVRGRRRRFYDYVGRGAPFGPDDGTLAPWSVVAALPFAPEIVVPTIENLECMKLREGRPYGYNATFNPTYPTRPSQPCGWVSPYHFGINQGPIVIMIENFRSDFPWQLTRKNKYIVAGLKRAGFRGGWLG